MSKIVERTLDLLELFAAEKRPLSLSDIARLMKIPVSSCHDVLQAMLSRGYLYELAPRAGYYPTMRLHRLGRTISEHDPVLQRADVLLRALRDELGESVLLAKVAGLEAHYLLVFESTHSLRFRAEVGDAVRSLYSTSAGKALLGSLDATALDGILASVRIPRMTDRTITSTTDLRHDIERGRARGWYLNQGESQEAATALSATFRWGSAVYVVTIAGPSSRLDHRLEPAAALLTAACTALGNSGR
jgi:IclR family transcriptional regulator, acetate operon repressor